MLPTSTNPPPLPSSLFTPNLIPLISNQQAKKPHIPASSPKTHYQNLDFNVETDIEFAPLDTSAVSVDLLHSPEQPYMNSQALAIRVCDQTPEVSLI